MTNVLLQLVRDIINGECYQQARNQLGTPEGAKSFPRGAQIF